MIPKQVGEDPLFQQGKCQRIAEKPTVPDPQRPVEIFGFLTAVRQMVGIARDAVKAGRLHPPGDGLPEERPVVGGHIELMTRQQSLDEPIQGIAAVSPFGHHAVCRLKCHEFRGFSVVFSATDWGKAPGC